MTASTITGWGHEVPDNVVTNDDMAQRVDTSDAWIRERSGIRERRHATDGETTATMSIACATRALERAGVAPAEVDLVLVLPARTTSRRRCPAKCRRALALPGRGRCSSRWGVQASCTR